MINSVYQKPRWVLKDRPSNQTKKKVNYTQIIFKNGLKRVKN